MQYRIYLFAILFLMQFKAAPALADPATTELIFPQYASIPTNGSAIVGLFGVEADVWSVTSFNELRRDGLAVERQNFLHPEAEEQDAYITSCLKGRQGPVIASTDYMRSFADQIRPWVKSPYSVLGTDGFGRSDSRQKLRHFFEVDRHFVVLAALNALRKEGKVDAATVKQAIEQYGIDTDKPYPVMH